MARETGWRNFLLQESGNPLGSGVWAVSEMVGVSQSLPDISQVCDAIVPVVDQIFGDLGEIERTNKEDGSFVTVMDTRLQDAIFAELRQRWPAVGVLGEEMSRQDQASLLEARGEEPIWVLDPLDGTTNFSTALPLYGVSLALVQGGETLAALVYDPLRQECFVAERGQGAWLNQQRLSGSQVLELGDCIANVDYKRLTRDLAAQLVVCPPYRSQRNIGTCVLEWCWLAADRLQLYLHGGQQLWDHAAGHLILAEAGGVARTLEGECLSSNTLGKQSVVAAASPALYAAWQEWIIRQQRGSPTA